MSLRLDLWYGSDARLAPAHIHLLFHRALAYPELWAASRLSNIEAVKLEERPWLAAYLHQYRVVAYHHMSQLVAFKVYHIRSPRGKNEALSTMILALQQTSTELIEKT